MLTSSTLYNHASRNIPYIYLFIYQHSKRLFINTYFGIGHDY